MGLREVLANWLCPSRDNAAFMVAIINKLADINRGVEIMVADVKRLGAEVDELKRKQAEWEKNY